MKTSSLLKKSKFLSKLLRHNPELIESTIDKEGWMNTSDLIKSGEFTIDELEQIVKEDNKERYELTKDKRKIRALQGHSNFWNKPRICTRNSSRSFISWNIY